MSVKDALSAAVAFQIKFVNREDPDIRQHRESLWQAVEDEINKLIEERGRLLIKRK